MRVMVRGSYQIWRIVGRGRRRLEVQVTLRSGATSKAPNRILMHVRDIWTLRLTVYIEFDTHLPSIVLQPGEPSWKIHQMKRNATSNCS